MNNNDVSFDLTLAPAESSSNAIGKEVTVKYLNPEKLNLEIADSLEEYNAAALGKNVRLADFQKRNNKKA